MKRILSLVMALWLALAPTMAFADLTATPASTVFRVSDSIGDQFWLISGAPTNEGVAWRGGFGGVGDTLAADSTVSRGTLLNIKRIKESNDAGLAELLPIFVSSRTQLDSSYMYNKWSSVCWGLNNYFSAVGGLNGWQQARPDSGRFNPYFARVARANGIYLTAKAVFPSAYDVWDAGLNQWTENLGSAVLAVDSAFTYSDSNAIDSSLFGPARIKTVADYASGFSVRVDTTGASVGSCSLLIYGSNQSLVHGRKWAYLVPSADGEIYVAPAVAGDSIYNIDSVKVRMVTATMAARFKFRHSPERVDSL